MKNNKKYIAFIAILLVLIIIPVSGVQAAKLKCDEIPARFCPSPGIDGYGNACTTNYIGSEMRCTFRANPKTCEEIYNEEHVCKDVDGYGNTCKQEYDGKCHIEKKAEYKELLTCEEYNENYQLGCPTSTGDYKGNKCGMDSQGQCYTVTDNTSCSEIKDEGLCRSKADKCRWVNISYGNYSCITLVQPTEASPACNTIKNTKECAARADCSPIGNKCVNYSDYKNIIGGTDIISTEVPFKCSDVKYLTGAWLIIRIIAPFLVILLGSLDFFKSMIANDEKEMKKSRGKFIKRLIAFVLLIFLPFLVQLIFSNMGTYGSENICLVKCIVTNDTSSKGCD